MSKFKLSTTLYIKSTSENVILNRYNNNIFNNYILYLLKITFLNFVIDDKVVENIKVKIFVVDHKL